jgi:hypothetical protein
MSVLTSVGQETDSGTNTEDETRCGLMSEAGENPMFLENILRFKSYSALARQSGVQWYMRFKGYFAVNKAVDRLFAELRLSRRDT